MGCSKTMGTDRLQTLTGKPEGEQGHQAKPDTSWQIGWAVGHANKVVFVGLPSYG